MISSDWDSLCYSQLQFVIQVYDSPQIICDVLPMHLSPGRDIAGHGGTRAGQWAGQGGTVAGQQRDNDGTVAGQRRDMAGQGGTGRDRGGTMAGQGGTGAGQWRDSGGTGRDNDYLNTGLLKFSLLFG